MRKTGHTGKKTQAKTARPSVTRRATAPSCLKPTGVITLNAADSRKLADYLSAPAREPNDYMKAALADYRRLIRTK
ncbi:MAG: hypothetical protein ACLP7P_20415 [Rhodomicrobium sp.]